MHSVELKLLPNEYWWGGLMNSPYRMPFPVGAEVNLNNLNGNCAQPLLISNKGRVVWSEEPFTFNLSQAVLKITTNIPSGEIISADGCDTLRGAYLYACKTFFPSSGKMPSPDFFRSPQYNTWIEMTYYSTQARVLEYAKAILSHGFPPGVLMIDTLWHPTYGNWVFDAGRYPDPKGMVARLHEMGFKVMLWIVPYVTADTLTYRELRDKGLLLMDPDGSPAIIEWWDGFSAGLNLTSPDALAWLHEQLGKLVSDIGIDGYKLDGGQPINYDLARIKYPHQVTQAWNRVGLRYPMAEYKDLWKSAGLPVAQRIRDRFHSWDADNGLGSLIPMALEQGLLGYSFTCPDMIGGGEYKDFPMDGGPRLDQELFVRYAQAAALFPMMQFSAAPWRWLSPDNLNLCLEAARLHLKMAPEILALAKESAQSGEPIMRHLEYTFPGLGYERINDQFLLGDTILVAPVVKKGLRSRMVIFPPGKWRNEQDVEYRGPGAFEVPAPLELLPWFRQIAYSE